MASNLYLSRINFSTTLGVGAGWAGISGVGVEGGGVLGRFLRNHFGMILGFVFYFISNR